MDAVTYVKEYRRLCNEHSACVGCPMNKFGDCVDADPEEVVKVVEKWSKEHPIKSNGDKLIDFVEENGGHFFGCNTGNGVITISTSLDWWDAEYKGV